MTEPNSMNSEMARYWNDSGGRRWAANLARVERMLEPLAAELLRFAAPRAGERVLDVGCGGGPTSQQFAAAVGAAGEVIGLDVSAVILERARARYGDVRNLRFVQGDAGSMVLEPAHYDLVTSRFGVMFFPDPVGAFRHLRPALKASGRLRFICWQELKLNPWMAQAARTAFDILPRPTPTPPNAPGPFAFADPVYLRGVLADAGFTGIEIQPHQAVLDLGSVEDALEQMTRMGPAAQAFDEADEATQARVRSALREMFGAHVAGGSVRFDSATWLVAAQPR